MLLSALFTELFFVSCFSCYTQCFSDRGRSKMGFSSLFPHATLSLCLNFATKKTLHLRFGFLGEVSLGGGSFFSLLRQGKETTQ